MDGMDGRGELSAWIVLSLELNTVAGLGQVIVIGATNRPDSVDPALRRPGRFDREFYFPLPNKEARKKIISINTHKWDPPLEERLLDDLAGMTKGYGGADLRVSIMTTESYDILLM
jgi:SpoVK/Ycf46/Vps4 family AAA+-type ATPase